MKELTKIEIIKFKIDEIRQQEYKKTFRMAKNMHMAHVLKFACHQIAYWNATINYNYQNTNTKYETNPLKIMKEFIKKDYEELKSILSEWNLYMKEHNGLFNSQQFF